jgi:hypothetical protein
VTDAEVTAPRSYRPGSWFGIFGEAVLVCLPPSEKARVGALWEMVDDGASFDEVLDALISGGLRDLPGFVLVSQGEETKVVIRGRARATFVSDGQEISVDGGTAATWVERSIPHVRAMGIDLDEESQSPLLPIHTGLVRVAGVVSPSGGSWVPAERGSHAAGEGVVPAPPDFPVDFSDEESDAAIDQTADQPVVEPAGGPAFEPVPTPAEPPAPRSEAVVEHDGDTVLGAPSEESAQPGIPGQEPAPAVTSRPVARLVFSSGETVEVDRAILVGRAPEARRFASGDQPRLVSVPSPQQEISSTHLEIRPGSGADHGTAVVTDLGSTNGTVLVQPGLPPEDLTPGVAIQLIPGAIIDLGDGVTIQVINP